jgi:hypothetical protein
MGETKILMKEEIRFGIDGLLAKFYGNPIFALYLKPKKKTRSDQRS